MFRRETFVERRDLLAGTAPICVDCFHDGIRSADIQLEGRLTVCYYDGGGAECSAELRGGGNIDCWRHFELLYRGCGEDGEFEARG